MSISHSLFCKGCWQHMHVPIPIRGPLSVPFRMVGVRGSQMNPNLCTICETQFTKVKRTKQIVVSSTVLLRISADTRALRGERGSRRRQDAERFHDDCASAVWERDGIVNKFMGDACSPCSISRSSKAITSARPCWRGGDPAAVCREQPGTSGDGSGTAPIHRWGRDSHRTASIGEVGTAYRDFTIIGPAVNMASRIQGAAKVGEILVTEAVYQQVTDLFPRPEIRACTLKGIDGPVNAYSLRP